MTDSIYERTAKATNDIVTPANLITLTGLVLSVYGATHIYETAGVLEFGAGRALDALDGFVARRTYSSRLGAKFDGTADKIAMAAAIVGAYHFQSAPEIVLGALAATNLINASANIYMESKDTEPKTSDLGKWAITANGYVGLGAMLLGHSLDNNAVETAGYATFALSTPLAAKVSYDYARNAFKIRKDFQRRKR